jgi:hypothetical protein
MQGDEECEAYPEDHQGNQKVTVGDDCFGFFERGHENPDRRVLDWRNHKDVAGPMSRFSGPLKGIGVAGKSRPLAASDAGNTLQIGREFNVPVS